MAIWQIEFSKEAFKSYQKLDSGYQHKINYVLERLMNKERIDIKPVENEADIYRIRIGRYRMLIKLFTAEKVILVAKIGPRGDVYK